MSAILKPTTHIVDVIGNVIGRDQPILRISKALEFTSILGNEVFNDNDVVFFDPFCKAGEVLLACSMQRCISKSKRKLIDVEDIINEIYKSNRYFALAPDERHHRLSLRTFLGNTHSHNEKFNHIIRNGYYLSEVDGKFNKNKFEKELNKMIKYIKEISEHKKIIAVGNPPYQEEDGGAQKSAKPIYQIFVEKLVENRDISQFVLVIPARWFAGGKGLDKFRKSMIDCGKIKNIRHFEKSGDVFPTVDIDGGICYLNWDRSYSGNPKFITDTGEQEVDLSLYDIIPDDPMAHEILRKIRVKWKGIYISDKAWSRKPFGLATDYFNKNTSETNGVKCLSRNKTVNFIRQESIAQNREYINHWKVCIPGAYGGKKGQRRKTLPSKSIFIIEPGTVVTETYMVIDVFKDKKSAEHLVTFLGTDFSRYLLGLRKITQHIPRERWSWVPYLPTKGQWNDNKIFRYFDLSEEDIKHIRQKVKEWS